mgnify:FL=1
MPRDKRYLLGDRLMTKALDLQDLLITASLTKRGDEKTKLLATASLELDKLRFLLRLTADSQILDYKGWQYCSLQITEIGKMLGGWLKNNVN